MGNRNNKRAIQNLRGAARERVEQEEYKRNLANQGYGAGTNNQKGRKERKGVICPAKATSQTPYQTSSPGVTRVYIKGGGHDQFFDHHTDIVDPENEEWKGYDTAKRTELASMANDMVPFLVSNLGPAASDGSNNVEVSLDVEAGSYTGFKGDPSHGVHAHLRVQGNINGPSFVPSSGVQGAQDQFRKKGVTPVLKPSRPAPEVIEAKAKSYDESQDLPNKPNHFARFATEMHPDFVPYAKAVIFDLWDQLKASVVLNSTLRTVAKQKEMYEYVRDWRKANPDKRNASGKHLPPGYGGAPAKPGHSKHNLGVAIDFNATIGSKRYSSRDQKAIWEASEIPRIIKSNGLRWGGDFSTNYDPIHMDLPVSNKVRSAIVAKTEKITDPLLVVDALSDISLTTGADNTATDNSVPI